MILDGETAGEVPCLMGKLCTNPRGMEGTPVPLLHDLRDAVGELCLRATCDALLRTSGCRLCGDRLRHEVLDDDVLHRRLEHRRKETEEHEVERSGKDTVDAVRCEMPYVL